MHSHWSEMTVLGCISSLLVITITIILFLQKCKNCIFPYINSSRLVFTPTYIEKHMLLANQDSYGFLTMLKILQTHELLVCTYFHSYMKQWQRYTLGISLSLYYHYGTNWATVYPTILTIPVSLWYIWVLAILVVEIYTYVDW